MRLRKVDLLAKRLTAGLGVGVKEGLLANADGADTKALALALEVEGRGVEHAAVVPDS